MGGGLWRDNFDGTYTQLDDDYDVPAAEWPYLDPYLISPAEVSDFFIVRNLVPAVTDAHGHVLFKADRTKVTIQEVITEEGPRLTGVDKSQRECNTGMEIVVRHGEKPSSSSERKGFANSGWIIFRSPPDTARTARP